jgi:predicted choloylglycine hydrolase
MTTIVEYTERKQPKNSYPERMVSPTSASACCQDGMETLGIPRSEGGWIFEYRRCRVCGFTVRAFLRYVLNDGESTDLRRRLGRCRLSGVSE